MSEPTEQSLGDKKAGYKQTHLTATEIECIKLLNDDGWTHDELAMVFEVNSSNITRFVNE